MGRLLEIKLALETGTWQPGDHRQFFVYDPKFRSIAAPPFADRVVHHAICTIIEPLFERRFIYDSYACRVDKGAHRGARRLQTFLRKKHAVYALKCDISKFFASIDHAVLCQIIRQTIPDPKLLEILDRIIAGYSPGIPIGNLTSQLFANVYLDQLDHFIKEELRVKYYLRYMDDFILLGENKTVLTKMLAAIRVFDGQVVNAPPAQSAAFPSRLGVDLVGYIVFPDHILLRPKTSGASPENCGNNKKPCVRKNYPKNLRQGFAPGLPTPATPTLSVLDGSCLLLPTSQHFSQFRHRSSCKNKLSV